MTSDKSVLTEARLNALLAGAGAMLATDWANFGALSASWVKNGAARYLLVASLVVVQLQNLGVGTTTNGTTIISAANGLPAGYRPGVATWVPVRADNVASQTTSLMFGTDGHVECWGIGSATRVDANVVFYQEL